MAGDFCDTHPVRIGIAQDAADFLQPTQQHILGWAHADKFGAARPKGPVAHPDQLAQLRHAQRPPGMFRQGLLEPNHDPGMMPVGVPCSSGAGRRQTVDQRMDQTLFEGPRDLGMRQHLGFCLGEPTDLRVQASQARCEAMGGLQDSPLRWGRKGFSGKGLTKVFELRGVSRDHVPDEGFRRLLMQPLATAVEHDLVCLQFGAAPHRQRSGMRRERHE